MKTKLLRRYRKNKTIRWDAKAIRVGAFVVLDHDKKTVHYYVDSNELVMELADSIGGATYISRCNKVIERRSRYHYYVNKKLLCQ